MKTRCLKVRLTEAEHARLAIRAVHKNTTITNVVRSDLGLERGSESNDDSYARRVATRWPNARAAG